MADGDRLTLRQAREQGRIPEFAAQAERDLKDAAPVSAECFNAIIEAAVKAPRSKDRTSHSRRAGNSTGKQTR